MKTFSRYTNFAVAAGSIIAAAAVSLGCPNDPVENETVVITSISPAQSYDSTYVGDTLRGVVKINVMDETQRTVDATLTWTSSNPAVLKIIGSNQTAADDYPPAFVPVSEGDAVVTATISSTTPFASGAVLVYHDNVAVAGPPASLKITPSSLALQVYQAGVTNVAAYAQPRAIIRSASGRAITSLVVNWQELTGNGVAEFCNPQSTSSTCSRTSSASASFPDTYYGLKPGNTRLAATLKSVAGRTLPNLADTIGVTVGGGQVLLTSPAFSTLDNVNVAFVDDAPQFTATVKNADGSVVSNPAIQWSTSRPAIATIDQTGKVKIVAASADDDTVTVLALAPTLGITGKFIIEARRAAAAVTVTPATISVALGSTARVYLHFTDKDGNPLHRFSGPEPQFTMDNSDIAIVRNIQFDDTTAAVTGVAAGDANLAVRYQGVSRSIPVKVLPVVANITLQYVTGTTTRDYNSAGETIAQGATAKLVATAVDANGKPFSDQFTFTTTASGITLAPSGLNTVTITGVSAGTNFPVVITGASNTAFSTTAKITVTAPVPTGGPAVKFSILSTPANATTGVGGNVQFSANATDAAGKPASGCVVNWNIDLSAIASIISSSGYATGVGAGSTAVRASCNGTNVGSAAKMTVVDGTYGVTKIAIAPKKYDYVLPGGSSLFVATVTQTSSGANAPITWFIDAAATSAGVTIDQTGLVHVPTNTTAGGVTITAKAGGQSDVAWITYGNAGAIRGTITSASTDRYLAGSYATAQAATGGPTITSVVDDNGQFYLVGLEPGRYTVAVTEQGAPGQQVFTNVLVSVGTTTPLTLTPFGIRN